MRNKFSGLLLLAIVVLMASCSKKGPSYAKYIPKEASYAVSLDVRSMVMKLEKDSLSVENMLQVIRDSSNPSRYSKAIEIWNQFKDAGLDLENRVMITLPELNLNGGNVTVQVLAGLKDASKLETFIAKMPNAPKILKEGDISYAVRQEMVIGWNKDAVMMLVNHAAPVMPNMYGDSADVAPAPVPGASSAVLEQLKKYFNLKTSESITSIDAFNDLAAEKGDVTIFTNNSSLAIGARPALTFLTTVKELLSGIYSTTVINFEEGKMAMTSNTFVGPKLADILKKYAGPTVDMSLLEAYPGNNVDGIAAFSFKPELFLALLQASGLAPAAEPTLSQAGLTSTDIVKAFKGDFAVIFSDFSINRVPTVTTEGYSYNASLPAGKLVFAMRINDKAAFEKILAFGTRAGAVVRQGNRLYPARGGVIDTTEKVFAGIENDLVVMSNDEATYKNYVARTGKNDISNEAKAAIKGSSVAVYIDGGKLLNGIPETMFDTTAVHERNIFNRSKSLFKTFDFTAANFDGKKITGKGEVIMADGKNSLSQLVSFLMYTAEEMKQRDAENDAKWFEEDVLTDSIPKGK